jgi:hypothetical protein
MKIFGMEKVTLAFATAQLFWEQVDGLCDVCGFAPNQNTCSVGAGYMQGLLKTLLLQPLMHIFQSQVGGDPSTFF